MNIIVKLKVFNLSLMKKNIKKKKIFIWANLKLKEFDLKHLSRPIEIIS